MYGEFTDINPVVGY